MYGTQHLVKVLFVAAVFFGASHQSVVDDGFAFPESYGHKTTICPKNQQMYYNTITTDDPYTWFCDCAPGHIFHERSESCHMAYTKGPCAKEQYIVLLKPKYEAKCIKNLCKTENSVRFEGKCYELDKWAPQKKCYITINPSTLQPDCMNKIKKNNVFTFLKKACPAGSKRMEDGTCEIHERRKINRLQI